MPSIVISGRELTRTDGKSDGFQCGARVDFTVSQEALQCLQPWNQGLDGTLLEQWGSGWKILHKGLDFILGSPLPVKAALVNS